MPYADPARARARRRHREHMRRVTVSDITPEQELDMRKRARKCPLCDVRMTDKPHLPSSKELDHILPVSQGGTHTHGNVRIICRKCNQSRPKDGSDYTGPLTLWAQGPAPVSRPNRNANTETCRNGLHPWIPANIEAHGKRKQCRLCREARSRAPLRQCECGASFAVVNQFVLMCPACIDAAARKAAELHASGLSWTEIAPLVGYVSAWGIACAARRIGYVPAKGATAKGAPKACGSCGQPVAEARGRAGSRSGPLCQACRTARAWQAVELRLQGQTLEVIASQLGYASKSSVTNLINSVTVIDSQVRHPHTGDTCTSRTVTAW